MAKSLVANNQQQPLVNKVALLYDVTDSGGHDLAVSLAENGADIAIVYRQAYAGQARETKCSVESEGRRCLILPTQNQKKSFSKDVVRRTINILGRLDIYIDYSSPPDRTHPVDLTQKSQEIPRRRDDPLTETDEIESRSNNKMRLAQKLINKPIITINEGQEIGKVQDFYLDQNLTHILGIYLGSEGLINRSESLIKRADVVKFGLDAVLIKDASSVMETSEVEEFDEYIRREEIQNRPVDTPGGTKIGRIGDVIFDSAAKITGFVLSQTFVSGPIEENRAISREAVVDIGNDDSVLTVDLTKAENADLQVTYQGFLGAPMISQGQSKETTASA